MPTDYPTVYVLIADGRARDALAARIRGAGWHAETFASLPVFLAHPRAPGPGCLLLDVELAGLCGLDVQRMMAIARDTPVISWSAHIAAGQWLEAVRQGLARSQAALAEARQVNGLRAAWSNLTARERQVMALVTAGLLNKQIGGELGISEVTVKQHRGSLMRKMNADSLPDLVRMADRLAVLPPRAQALPARRGRSVMNIAARSVSVRAHETFRSGTQAQGGA